MLTCLPRARISVCGAENTCKPDAHDSGNFPVTSFERRVRVGSGRIQYGYAEIRPHDVCHVFSSRLPRCSRLILLKRGQAMSINLNIPLLHPTARPHPEVSLIIEINEDGATVNGLPVKLRDLIRHIEHNTMLHEVVA